MSDAALKAILEREAKVRAQLCDPSVTEIDVPNGMFAEQIGLRTVCVDPIGRIWDTGDRRIKMIFDPLFLTRKKEKTDGNGS